jgi:transcriptional regulator with XRE-family HTH domain
MPGPWGKAIEQLRLAKGWTREHAAKRAKMTATTFGRLEKGRHTRTEKLQQIADAFDVPLEDVLIPTGEARYSDIDQLLQRKIRDGVREELTARRKPTAHIRADVRVSVQRSIEKLPVLGERNPDAALLIERSIDDYMPPPDDNQDADE